MQAHTLDLLMSLVMPRTKHFARKRQTGALHDEDFNRFSKYKEKTIFNTLKDNNKISSMLDM